MALGGSARSNPRGHGHKFASFGGGVVLYGLTSHTVSVDPASIAANTKAATAVTVAGAKVGDFILTQPPSTLEAGLSPAGTVVTAPDTVSLNILNSTAAPIDGTARNWTFLIFHLS